MEYLGDFPPCQHRFINSNGMIICQFCGMLSQANRTLQQRIDSASTRLR
jgi:hypothetical protein